MSFNQVKYGPIIASSDLNVSGHTNLQGQVTAMSSLNVIGDSILKGTVLAVKSLTVSGPSELNGDIIAKGSLQVDGNLTAFDMSITSDIKLKNSIKPLENSLDKVLILQGVSYFINGDNKKKIGFIAQEIEQVYPELVLDNGEFKSVTYPNVTAILVEAIKELKTKYDDLESKYNDILSKLNN
jgi:cytoskeletal protein CcmA (bactofilin family)